MTEMTSMERHVLQLVEHLRNGQDTQAGFLTAIDRARGHAQWLEKQNAELRAEVRRLETYMMPMPPSVTCSSKDTDFSNPMAQVGGRVFEWRMEPIQWRGIWHGYNAHQAAEPALKRRTYRELLRLFRREFEKTWTLNHPRSRRRRG